MASEHGLEGIQVAGEEAVVSEGAEVAASERP